MAFTGDWQALHLQPEKEQAGAIFYEDGYENLLLSVSLDWNTTGNRSVWIFPVPADPQNVTIDLVREGYPYYRGKSLDGKYWDTHITVFMGMALYSTFPLSFLVTSAFFTGTIPHGGGALGLAEMPGNGIRVYDQVEKMGLSSELITADNADALEDYLNRHNLVLPPGSKPRLDEYIDKKYSLIITSVNNVSEYRSQFGHSSPGYGFPYSPQDMLSVSARFPTSRAYFPLKLTQAYGNRTIPITIAINGWVTPQVPEKISPDTKVIYMTDGSDEILPDSRAFFNGQNVTPSDYTKIQINTPSDNFTGDLWFDPGTPINVTVTSLFVHYPIVLGILLYVPFSMLASLIAGMIVFRRSTVPKSRMLLHGLWNCTTMIGFVYATSRRLILPEEQAKNKKLFVIVFLGVFLLLMYIYIVTFLSLMERDFILAIVQYSILLLPAVCLSILFVTFALLTNIPFYGWHVSFGKYVLLPIFGQLIFFATLAAFIWGMDRSLNIIKNREFLVLAPVFLLILAGIVYLISLMF